MIRTGIATRVQFERVAARTSRASRVISCELMQVADDCTEAEQSMFERAQFYLQTANRTFRTSFAGRFKDVDKLALELLTRRHRPDAALLIQDRAASHALTSCEWATAVFQAFPQARLEASDLLLYLVRLAVPGGGTYIADPAGMPMQYIRGRFVVSLCAAEPRRYPLNRLLAARARRGFPRHLVQGAATEGTRAQADLTKISCVHPRARVLAKRDPRFTVVQRSVFDRTEPVDVIRTMNIFNRSYFSQDELAQGASAVFASLREGGLWIVGRTSEDDFTNEATFLQKTGGDWSPIARLRGGSEMEPLLRQIGPSGRLRQTC